jgi:2-aminoadipate transaminase
LLAHALASGRYDRHQGELRRRYARKADVMAAALRKHFPPEVEWSMPEGGLYFWARLPGAAKAGTKSKLFQAALRSNVLYVPGELCYAEDPTRRKPAHEMRISFGSSTEQDIHRGIERLGRALRKVLPP